MPGTPGFGVQGATGVPGNMGFPGATGLPGSPGFQGAIGWTGAQGNPGQCLRKFVYNINLFLETNTNYSSNTNITGSVLPLHAVRPMQHQ